MELLWVSLIGKDSAPQTCCEDLILITCSSYKLRMSKLVRFLTGLIIFSYWQFSIAADISSYFLLTSDHVFRGVTQSDGDPAVQVTDAAAPYLGHVRLYL